MARTPRRSGDLQALAALREELTRAAAQKAKHEQQLEQTRRQTQQQAARAAQEFAQAVHGTVPLPARYARAPLQLRRPAPDRRGSPDAPAAPSARPGAAPSTAAPGADDTSYRSPGVGPDVPRKLRRGHWSVDEELDLHGLNAQQAHWATQRLLDAAQTAGWRCVRIIHGKGLGSTAGTPVLKGMVRSWLSQHAAVIAFCEAPAAQGGAGAVLALLR